MAKSNPNIKVVKVSHHRGLDTTTVAFVAMRLPNRNDQPSWALVYTEPADAKVGLDNGYRRLVVNLVLSSMLDRDDYYGATALWDDGSCHTLHRVHYVPAGTQIEGSQLVLDSEAN